MEMQAKLNSFGDQLKFAMDLAGIEISIIDLKGRWFSWNEFSEKYFCRKVDGGARKNPASSIQLGEAEFKEVMNSAARKGIYNGAVELSKKCGSKGWNHLIVTKLFDRRGAHVGFICITKDMAEKNDPKEEALANNKEIEEFIYTLCHDLKTPLCAIEGYSSLLVEEYEDKIDDEGRDFLGRITDNTARMAKLIDQLREYSNAAKSTTPYERVDLSEVAREALANINDQVDGKKVTCTIHHLPMVYGEKSKMLQVFNQLLENSIRFSQNENPTIEIDCKEEEQMYQVSIKENVRGLSMENHDKVLQMVQSLNGGANHFAGGLGLAIAKKIVENHGGSVWAEGEQKKESAFCFTLPKGKNRSSWNDGILE